MSPACSVENNRRFSGLDEPLGITMVPTLHWKHLRVLPTRSAAAALARAFLVIALISLIFSRSATASVGQLMKARTAADVEKIFVEVQGERVARAACNSELASEELIPNACWRMPRAKPAQLGELCVQRAANLGSPAVIAASLSNPKISQSCRAALQKRRRQLEYMMAAQTRATADQD